jgi:hypothetical protein
MQTVAARNTRANTNAGQANPEREKPEFRQIGGRLNDPNSAKPPLAPDAAPSRGGCGQRIKGGQHLTQPP